MDTRTSLVFSLQTYLAETPEQKKNSTGPGYLSVFMSGTFSPFFPQASWYTKIPSSATVMALGTVCPYSFSNLSHHPRLTPSRHTYPSSCHLHQSVGTKLQRQRPRLNNRKGELRGEGEKKRKRREAEQRDGWREGSGTNGHGSLPGHGT